MRCKHYKVEDAASGYCRAESALNADVNAKKVMVHHDHACQQWIDCGQNYYIRLGWLKARQNKQTADLRQ
ncbi:MAG: hypothetical protein C4563_06150 [Desulfobulbus sp.]|nr:MAG: hypothetical protein C4563_06150 [Desulfobulbus sp.]